MPLEAAAKSKKAKQYTHIHKIKQRSRKLQSRKIARHIKQALANRAITRRVPRSNDRANVKPEYEWVALTSAPISKAFMVTEQQLGIEINDTKQCEVESVNSNGFGSVDNDELDAEEEYASNLNDIMEKIIKEGILNDTIPSAAYDAAATSSCGKYGDPFLPNGRQSTKVFQTPTGHKVPVIEVRLLDHYLRNPAREVHMMSELIEIC